MSVTGETATSDSSGESWIEWFTSKEGNRFFCEVDRRYIEDNFNLYGLRQYVPNYSDCLDIILDHKAYNELNIDPQKLYGLIHQRYILTGRGMEKMRYKFLNNDFGTCPRYYCRGQPCLPVGMSDVS